MMLNTNMDNVSAVSSGEAYTSDALWEAFKITPETLLSLRIIESSVYLTRRCNISCQYCKIIKTHLSKELSIEQWMEVFTLLNNLGIRFVNIAGGEPTVLKGLGRLIKHLNTRTNLQYSIVSNSVFNDNKLNELIDAGLTTYVASIDGLEQKHQGLSYLKKSSAGLNMLKKLREGGVPNLCANIVITAKNIGNVMDVVRYLNDHEIWANICPVVWGKGDNWQEIEKEDENYRLTDIHREMLETISEELVEMKRKGNMILPTESYLKQMPTYGIGLDWRCFLEKQGPYPPRLFIDADGAIMSCINFRGETARKYNIFDFEDVSRYDTFIKEWWDDVGECPGCYWSTMVMAKERIDMVNIIKQRLIEGQKNRDGAKR